MTCFIDVVTQKRPLDFVRKCKFIPIERIMYNCCGTIYRETINKLVIWLRISLIER